MKNCGSAMAHFDCKFAITSPGCGAPYRAYFNCCFADLGGFDKVNLPAIINAMRHKLTDFQTYQEACEIRQELHKHALKYYVPDNDALTHLKFLNDNQCTFEIVGPQDQNHPFYLRMFCTATQHVYGDCVEECLDNAIRMLTPEDVSCLKPEA